MQSLIKLRDLAVLWKIKIQRVMGYVSLVNSSMILFLFAQQLHEWPFIKNHISFKAFIITAYLLGILGVLIMAEIDWKFLFRREVGYNVSRNPIAITECLRSAYILHKMKEGGIDISDVFEKLRLAFYLAGYEREFLEFWGILEKERDERGD